MTDLDRIVVEGEVLPPQKWRWYCRIDGAEGAHPSRDERDRAALHHRDEVCEVRDRPNLGHAEYGHLAHVWRY
jgi:hypothetical protein